MSEDASVRFHRTEAYLLHQAVVLLDRRAQALLADVGISYPEFLVAMAVRNQQNPSQNDVAGWLGLSKSIVSQRVASLKEKGFVAQRRDAANHRIVRLRLTPAGREMLDRAYPELSGGANAVFDVLGEGREEFARQLGEVVDAMMVAEGLPPTVDV